MGNTNDKLPSAAAEKRLTGLDGVRAIAIALVLICHFVPRQGDVESDAVLNQFGFGVTVFFVLSGFLITHLLLREEATSESISLRSFYIRRGLRILPPLFLYLIVLAILDWVSLIAVPPADYVASVFFVRNYFGHSAETGHCWSLAIEEQFYLMWPALVVLIRSAKARFVACLLVLIVVPVWRHAALIMAGGAANVNLMRTDFRLDALVMGAALACLRFLPTGFRLARSRWVANSAIGICAIAVIVVTQFTDLANIRYVRIATPSIGMVAVAVCINVVVSNPRSTLARILEWSVVVWIGRLSYSLYLWQQLYAGTTHGMRPVWFRELGQNLCLSLACAVLSFYVLERPLMSLRSRFRPTSNAISTVATQ